MTSTTAMESKSVAGSQKNDKLHRGRNVVLAFLMQGWGQLFNQAVLIILLLIFHHSGNPPYSEVSAQWTYRVSFAIMAAMTLWLAYFRFYKKKYTSAALRRSKKNMRVNQSGYDLHSLKLVGTHFAGRLVGTTMGWLFNDFLFYGNKLFASTFIEIISPNAAGNVIVTWNWNMVNIGVSLCGYYLAAFLIDHKFYGRKRMQIIGFLGDAVLFMICASKFSFYGLEFMRFGLPLAFSLVHSALLSCAHQGLPNHLLPFILLPAIRSQLYNFLVGRRGLPRLRPSYRSRSLGCLR